MEKSILSQLSSQFDTQVAFGHRYVASDLSPAASPLSQRSTRELALEFNGVAPGVSANGIETGMPRVGDEASKELWSWGGSPQVRLNNGICSWRIGGYALLAGCCASRDDTLSRDTQALYESLLTQAADLGCRYPVRLWNYLPHINRGEGDLENYKRFCEGRKQAFDFGQLDKASYPAASALGHKHDSLLVYGLFGASPGRHFENPDQISAYRYPRQYGPQSPSFARATWVGLPEGGRLYFSGTASVIGHQTQHQNDVLAQTLTTLENLDKLFLHVKEEASLIQTPNADMLKVYLRYQTDYKKVRGLILSRFPDAQILFVEADICRADLLIEIDGHCGL